MAKKKEKESLVHLYDHGYETGYCSHSNGHGEVRIQRWTADEGFATCPECFWRLADNDAREEVRQLELIDKQLEEYTHILKHRESRAASAKALREAADKLHRKDWENDILGHAFLRDN